MKSLKFYNSSTRWFVSSLGSNQVQVADRLMCECKSNRRSISTLLSTPSTLRICLEGSQASSHVNIAVITGEIGSNKYRTSSNVFRYFTTYLKAWYSRFWVRAGLTGLLISFLIFKRYLARHGKKWCAQPSCWAVESDQRLFLECDPTAQMSLELLFTWNEFFSSRSSWTHIACAIVSKLWHDYQQLLPDLWLALQRPASPTLPALSVMIYTTFIAYVPHFWRQRYDQDEHIRLSKMLDLLVTQGFMRRISEIDDHYCGYRMDK